VEYVKPLLNGDHLVAQAMKKERHHGDDDLVQP
jgi:hypothetical protein